MTGWDIVFAITKIIAFTIILGLLLYITIQVNFIAKNLAVNCTGKMDFDPTKNYVASFVFPHVIQKTIGKQSIEGSLTGKKSSSTEGTFSVSVTTYKMDGTPDTPTTFDGQKYVYDKTSCTLKYTFVKPTDGSKGIEDYLSQYNITLTSPAYLVPNDGIRLAGQFKDKFVTIPLEVTAYPK